MKLRVVNLLFHYFHNTYVITCARFRLKRVWRLTNAMSEMKRNTEQRDDIGVAVQSWL